MKKYKGSNDFHQGWIDYIQGVLFNDDDSGAWRDGWIMAAETGRFYGLLLIIMVFLKQWKNRVS